MSRVTRSDTIAEIDETGRATWILPLQLSVKIPLFDRSPPGGPPPGATSAAAAAPPPPPGGELPVNRYLDRGGYKRAFLDGFDIPLPDLGDLSSKAARNKFAQAGDDPFELKYHHYSVVMNRERRLAFFTACNIDGATAKSVDRDTKAVSPLRPDSAGMESFESLADAEADTWFVDNRIDPSEYTGETFYAKQKIPGFPDPRSKGRIARMFQKGHLVRRTRPLLG